MIEPREARAIRRVVVRNERINRRQEE